MYDITHADDVVRETDKSPTLNARMGTGGNQVPILMGDIPSEKAQCLNPQSSQGERIYSQDGICQTLRSGCDTGGRGYPNAYVMQEQDKDLKTEVVIMGHDERNARFNINTTDPLTACDYKQPQIIAQMSTTGGAERIRNRERTDGTVRVAGQGGNAELYARPDCYYATSCDGRSTIGSLCAHDGRGFNGQDVNQGKLIIQYESHNDN